MGALRSYHENKNIKELKSTLDKEQECLYKEIRNLVEQKLLNAITDAVVAKDCCEEEEESERPL